ncbi:MAG TPA: beta-ketoacyl synthase N-terminal-like domain-containing protein [Cyclobacteriaceae bacterium]|nr:beta-ketoacyl synthase N-terminal-like domain-containing protein [Cyclobacteriaceae bacterium]
METVRKVWLVADSVISPLGLSSEDNLRQILSGVSAVKKESKKFDATIFASHFSKLERQGDSTRFELIASMALAELKKQVTLPVKKTLFILSTTKGNIEVLEEGQPNHPRIHLHAIANMLAKEIGIEKSIVVSNACTSGVAALLCAKRFIESGNFDHAVVLGADTLNRFVISGFQSLHALSSEPCKPFDVARTGINLGEAASAVLLTTTPEDFNIGSKIQILGGSTSNDANHISGPSKTGEELAKAIEMALKDSGVGSKEIDFISAHGTATLYNDEMEAKAFHLAGMGNTPLHSLKGNFGHTLGAAGVVETVMCAQSLKNQKLIPTYGFEKIGVSLPVNVIKKSESKTMRMALKTASGFGGSNAALVLSI